MAFAMPAPERRMRWEAMMAKLRCGNIQHWFESFLAALESTHEISHNSGEEALPVEKAVGQSGSVLQFKSASTALH